MEKLISFYNDLAEMDTIVFSGNYGLSEECDSTVVRIGDSFGLFLDIERIRTIKQELSAVSHEWAHIVTGSTYTTGATQSSIQAAERRATRAQIKKLLPFEEMKEAIGAGYDNICELSDYFSVPEDLIRQAIDYYTGPCGLNFQNSN